MRSTRVRNRNVKSPIAFICIVVSFCCLLIVIMSVLKLPEVSTTDTTTHFGHKKAENSLGAEGIGRFGNMIVEMLPQDLAFTAFLPSGRAFHRDLRLNESQSLKDEYYNDTYAILTRILGFSVVPRMVFSVSVPKDEEIIYDSISGYPLHISKDLDGKLIVNRIQSEQVDLRKGEIVVHITDGVIMDAAFEQSVQPDEEE